MALALFGSDVSRAQALPLSTVTVALGGLSALVLLIHIIAPPGVQAGTVSIDLDPEFGVWLGPARLARGRRRRLPGAARRGASRGPLRARRPEPAQAPPPAAEGGGQAPAADVAPMAA